MAHAKSETHTRAVMALVLGAVASVGLPSVASGQAGSGTDSLAVIRISGPTVIAFWTVPESNAQLEADPDLAAALDDQQFYWSTSGEPLAALGVQAVAQPGRAFVLRDAFGDRTFLASADSSAVGYVLVAPGKPLRVVYRVWLPEAIVAEARLHFGGPSGRPD